MTKNVFGKDLHLKQIFFFFKLMLERGLFPVVWKMKSPSKICLPGDEGLAVNIFNYPPRETPCSFLGLCGGFQDREWQKQSSILYFTRAPLGTVVSEKTW